MIFQRQQPKVFAICSFWAVLGYSLNLYAYSILHLPSSAIGTAVLTDILYHGKYPVFKLTGEYGVAYIPRLTPWVLRHLL